MAGEVSLPNALVRRARRGWRRLASGGQGVGHLLGRLATAVVGGLLAVGLPLVSLGCALVAMGLVGAPGGRGWPPGAQGLAIAACLVLAFWLKPLVLLGLDMARLSLEGEGPVALLPAPVLEARLRVVRVRGRRAGVVEVSFDTSCLEPGRRVELAVTLQVRHEPRPLGSRHPGFRGPGNVFLARQLTDPIGEGDAMEMWGAVVFPLRALALPPGRTLLEGEGEVVLRVGEERVGEGRFDWQLGVLSEDLEPFAEAAPAPEAAPEGMEIVTRSERGGGLCKVCGDATDAHAPACQLCEARQHQDCWAYAGRCSTYACGGSPSAASPS